MEAQNGYIMTVLGTKISFEVFCLTIEFTLKEFGIEENQDWYNEIKRL